MTDRKNAQKKANDLLNQAIKLKTYGEFSKALELLNEAILVSEKEGLDPYPYKIQKELIIPTSSQTKDFSGLISVTKEQLDYYRNMNNVVQQIDLLLALAGLHIFTREFQQSGMYLNEVENLLISTPIEEISLSLSNFRGFSGQLFVELRLTELFRMRRFITNQE